MQVGLLGGWQLFKGGHPTATINLVGWLSAIWGGDWTFLKAGAPQAKQPLGLGYPMHINGHWKQISCPGHSRSSSLRSSYVIGLNSDENPFESLWDQTRPRSRRLLDDSLGGLSPQPFLNTEWTYATKPFTGSLWDQTRPCFLRTSWW